MAKPAKEAPVARNGVPLLELSLEALNHEKALLKIKLNERGKVAQDLRKEMGEINDSIAALDLAMLEKDQTYRQQKLELEAAKE